MSDEKSFSVCQEMLPLFRAVLKIRVMFRNEESDETRRWAHGGACEGAALNGEA